MSSIFKRAAVRGVAHSLVSQGMCEFPSKEAMDEAADAIADGPVGEQMPEVSPEQGHSPEQLAEAAQKLMEIAQALMQEAQGGAAGPTGAPPDPAGAVAAKQAAEQLKVACSQDVGEAAGAAAMACMDKAAEETKQGAHDPKLVGGGSEHKNTPAAAAKTDSVAALDNKNRPQGKYLVGNGQTDFDTAKGQIGASAAPTVSPSNSPGGSNSVTEGTKKSALRELVAKHANKLVGLHPTKENTLANSPDPLAKLDEKNRPGGKRYALVGQGNANFSEPQAARIGLEKKPDVKPSNSPGGSNSVTEASKAAEEEQFVAEFGKCAEDVGPYLPASLSEDEKVAAITDMISLSHDEREAKLNTLHKQASECKACTAEKKCEKHCEGGEKKSSLLDRVKEIANKASAQPQA